MDSRGETASVLSELGATRVLSGGDRSGGVSP